MITKGQPERFILDTEASRAYSEFDRSLPKIIGENMTLDIFGEETCKKLRAGRCDDGGLHYFQPFPEAISAIEMPADMRERISATWDAMDLLRPFNKFRTPDQIGYGIHHFRLACTGAFLGCNQQESIKQALGNPTYYRAWSWLNKGVERPPLAPMYEVRLKSGDFGYFYKPEEVADFIERKARDIGAVVRHPSWKFGTKVLVNGEMAARYGFSGDPADVLDVPADAQKLLGLIGRTHKNTYAAGELAYAIHTGNVSNGNPTPAAQEAYSALQQDEKAKWEDLGQRLLSGVNDRLAASRMREQNQHEAILAWGAMGSDGANDSIPEDDATQVQRPGF